MKAFGQVVRARAATPAILAMLPEFRGTALLTAKPKQARSMVAIVRKFLFSEHVTRAADLTRGATTHYLAELARRGRSPKTVRNHMSALSRFCEFLREEKGLLDGDPYGAIRLAKPEKKLPRWLRDDELRTVLKIARRQGIWPEVCLALATGLRLEELIRLHWSDVDVNRRCLTVRRAKSRRPRVVPLSHAALAALTAQRRKVRGAGLQPVAHHAQVTNLCHYVFPARQTWRAGWRYLDKPRASNWWRRAMRPIQDAVPKFVELPGSSTGRGWHLLRHTFASRSAQAGVSLYKLAAWMGHSDIRTTEIYAHLQVSYDADIEAAAPVPAGRRRAGIPTAPGDGPACLKAENELLHREIEQLRKEIVTLTVKGCLSKDQHHLKGDER